MQKRVSCKVVELGLFFTKLPNFGSFFGIFYSSLAQSLSAKYEICTARRLHSCPENQQQTKIFNSVGHFQRRDFCDFLGVLQVDFTP